MIDNRKLPTPCIVRDISASIIELSNPFSTHSTTHYILTINLYKMTMNFNWHSIPYVQERTPQSAGLTIVLNILSAHSNLQKQYNLAVNASNRDTHIQRMSSATPSERYFVSGQDSYFSRKLTMQRR
ncbi:hypothetical protein TNCV_4124731 [Trichonephila clavipes]|nr:hypothetical protein TNCV_4124731 [Trichonephila clavipes]